MPHLLHIYCGYKEIKKKQAVRAKELMRNKIKAKHIVEYERENGLCH